MDSRSILAVEKKDSGAYNCAQAVACSYADITGLDEDTLKNVTAAFGAGLGNMKGTCGALAGAGVVLGLVKKDKVTARAAMKRVMDRFQAANGSTVCGELKGIGTGCALRRCNDCVADAVLLLDSELAAPD